MKRLLNKFCIVLMLILCDCINVYSYDEVYLDVNIPEIHRLETGKLEYENAKLNLENDDDYLKPSFQTMKKMFDEDFYSPKKIITKKEKKWGKNTVGAKYDTMLNPNSASQTRTIYAKHDFTEKMSVGTSYKNNTMGGFNEQAKGTLSIAPEYRFTEKMSLSNVYSKNLSDKSNKGEIQLKYKPFKDERMDFNIGAGQKTFDDGQQSSSQLNFGTNFKF